MEENKIVRVYEARFKIPKDSNYGELMSGKSVIYKNDSDGAKLARFRQEQTNMIRYKRFLSYTSLIMMAIAFVLTIMMLVYNWSLLHDEYFYVARTRTNVTQEIDFENITTTKVQYYLYRNTTEGAADVDEDGNYFLTPNVEDVCGDVGYSFQLMDTLSRITAIRDNIYSPYMIISEVFLLA